MMIIKVSFIYYSKVVMCILMGGFLTMLEYVTTLRLRSSFAPWRYVRGRRVTGKGFAQNGEEVWARRRRGERFRADAGEKRLAGLHKRVFTSTKNARVHWNHSTGTEQNRPRKDAPVGLSKTPAKRVNTVSKRKRLMKKKRVQPHLGKYWERDWSV